MYREEQWRDGWLWVKSTPDGQWWPANTEDVIRALIERVTKLEAENEKTIRAFASSETV